MDLQPVIYSDFNGVYHVPGSKELVLIPTAEGSRYLRPESTVSWNPLVVELMVELVTGHGLKHRWLTTWNEQSNILRAVERLKFGEGFEDHITLDFDHSAESPRDWTRWKAMAIIEDQHRDPRPFLWIDDKAPAHWADFVSNYTEQPSLILQPHSRRGLEDEHFGAIREFLLELSNGEEK